MVSILCWRWLGIVVVCTALGVGCGGQKEEKTANEETQVPAIVLSDAEARQVIDRLTFVRIEPGTFTMGSPVDGPDKKVRNGGELEHKVTISKGFWIASHEVTQELYYAVMKINPSYFTDEEACPGHHVVYENEFGVVIPVCKNLPVEHVNWDDAQEFIVELNKIDDKGYRLPTEAEWEYAVRGGHTGGDSKSYVMYSFGNEIALLKKHAWYHAKKSGALALHPVGQKTPIKIGDGSLYDMHGNVSEWVQDGYGDYPDATVDPLQQPQPSQQRGSRHVVRGGDWTSRADDCRSAARTYGESLSRDGKTDKIGFRLIRTR